MKEYMNKHYNILNNQAQKVHHKIKKCNNWRKIMHKKKRR